MQSIQLSVFSPQDHRDFSWEGDRVVIGSSANDDLPLRGEGVGPAHVTLLVRRDELVVLDGEAEAGVRVRGVRVGRGARRLLGPSGTVVIGEIAIRADLRRSGRASFGLAPAESAPPKVRVVEGRDWGELLDIENFGPEYIVGRGERCHLRVADLDVSRRHVAIRRRRQDIYVRDLESLNGTFLGALRIAPGAPLLWDAQVDLRIGKTVLALVRGDISATTRRPSVFGRALRATPADPTRQTLPPESGTAQALDAHGDASAEEAAPATHPSGDGSASS